LHIYKIFRYFYCCWTSTSTTPKSYSMIHGAFVQTLIQYISVSWDLLF
jgi:hypothetical protein